MPKRKCQVAVVPTGTEVTTSDEELLTMTKMIEEEELAKTKRKIQEDESAKLTGARPKLPTPVPSKRILAVKPAAMGVKSPPPRQTGARSKLPTTAPSQRIMAVKPSYQPVGNDSSDEDILRAVLDMNTCD